MKSYNHLFEKLVDFDNIYNAILNASKGKRKRSDVKKILKHINRYVYRLQDIINGNKIQIRKHKAIQINDGINAKKRLIIKPDFMWEQILHHAIVQVLSPIFMKSMYTWSCGSLPKRGGLYGKKYLEKYIKENPTKIKYVAKLDIKKFFSSVDTKVLKKKLKLKIHDKKFLNILFVIIDSNIAEYQGNDIYMGLPIGYYLSQWLANWFLSDMDYRIKQVLSIKCYVRYVDDLVLFNTNKKVLHKAILYLKGYLTTLDLFIKGNHQVFRYVYEKDGKEFGRVLDFMGYKFYRNRVILRKCIMYKATRKAKKLRNYKKNWFECTQFISYMGWFKHSNTYNVYLKYIKPYVNIGDCKKVVSLHQYKINRKEKDNVIKMDFGREPRKTA